MRRISESEFSKKKKYAYLCSALIVVLAFVLIFAPELFPSPEYNELMEKEITVSEFRKVHRYKGGNEYKIYTADDEIYTLTGEFDYDEVKTILTEGTKARIKYSQNRFLFFSSDYAEEVSVNDNVIVSFDNDNGAGAGRIPLVILGVILIGIAAVNLYLRLANIRHLREQQAKRDRRIEKKYGKRKQNENNIP